MPLSQPPAQQRRAASHEDAARLEAICEVRFSLDDLPSLLDPRGKHFQRLEWLGDSILDALLAQHRRTEPDCCKDRDLEDLCSDRALSKRAEALGLADALDWQPSAGRLADLVEALVAAAWLAGPPVAVQVAEVLVHPRLTLKAVMPSAEDHPGCTGLRSDAQLGAALLEAADTLLLLEKMPDADEGELSTARGRDISGHRLVTRARQMTLLDCCRGPQEHLVDHVQAAVGRVSATEGMLPGLRLATRTLRGPQSPGQLT